MSTHPTFGSLPDANGLDVVDPIETRHFSLFTSAPVDPVPADPESFAFPVANACRIRTDGFELPYMVPMEVRTPDGDHLAAVDLPTTEAFPVGDYLLELHSPIKIYVRVTGAVAIDATEDSVDVEFDRERSVAVGARSYHSEPAATVTVPDDPEALMEAVSTFSSALKTTSPERAWPTLRGHPPRIERGDELSIPEGLDPPETGITIAVPPEYEYVLTVAPLAYYLGARVAAGETPRLTAESGVARFLGEDPEAVADAVESLLKRTLVLDCATRTEGLYPDDLHERSVLESEADLDFAALYDASPGERLREYLAVPDEAVAAVESPWHRVTHVQPGPEAAELLPYVVNDLSLVRPKTTGGGSWTPTDKQVETDEALSGFFRGPDATVPSGPPAGSPAPAGAGDPGSASGGDPDDFLRSVGTRRSVTRRGSDDGDESDDSDDLTDSESARGVPGEGGYMPLPETDALEQAWVGDRTPIQGTKLLKAAFEHDRATSEDGTVAITVVCNDEEMREELDSAAEIYGSRDDLRTDVTCEFGVSTDRLRDLLAADSDMFHFIGHIDGLGFKCSDGILDAEELDETGAKTVLLNGCRSHDQGVALVEAGARAAVVSLADLWNSGAVEVGETFARLLYHGFGVGAAVELVREYTSLGNQYVVLGDPGTTFTQCENNAPVLYHMVDYSNTREIKIEPCGYITRSFGIGSTVHPHISEPKWFILGGLSGKTTVCTEEIRETFQGDWPPIIVDQNLVWSKHWLSNI
ncbi:CHAT domain-containing protein (plasmid) [Halorussus salilacus]|uniref:CHAT domain-containing protein n=1 Tax=Halorussus salilacus TaxID=2953750 RepID=UPI00209E438C|nr:CHAT domain-containing protein [Halorussus salilacus]USZ69992.1 CHAT domain-containing protein [Halorussus salilacus]